MKILSFVLLTIISSAGAIALSSANRPATNGPAVVVAEAPAFSPLAKTARIEGEVRVKVGIDVKGNVISATKVSGNVLLSEASEKAAKGWQFVPASEGTDIRTAELSFVFLTVEKADTSRANSTVIFFPPYKVEVQDHPTSPGY